MKKVLLSAAVLCFLALPGGVFAQADQEKKEQKVKGEKKELKETQEIIIRNKGEKDLDLKVEIKGDNITVNGKPLSEFKDDQVIINKRKITIRNGDRIYHGNPDAMTFNRDFMEGWKGEGKGEVRPFLGVTTEAETNGAKVTEVVKESAAAKAGLKVNDVITKIGDKKVTEEESLAELISEKKPKESVKVTYLRDGKEASARVTLGERKSPGAMTFAYGAPSPRVRSFSFPSMPATPDMEFFRGEGLEGLDGTLAPGNGYGAFSFSRQKKIGLKISDTEEGGNVKVMEVEEGSAAEKAGIKKDDVITEIAGKKITNTDEAREQLNPTEAKSSYSVKALRNGAEMNFEIKIPKKLKTANL